MQSLDHLQALQTQFRFAIYRMPWPWLVREHAPGSVVTIFILGKDGFGLLMDSFKILNAQNRDHGPPISGG